MTAMQLTNPDISWRQAPGRSVAAPNPRTGLLQADQGAVDAPFQPLDPGVLSEAIPAFFIGRNNDGLWVARDRRGRIGGIFLFERSALSFARRNSEPAGCATIFPAARFELDLENNGNPLAAHLARLLRLVRRGRSKT